MSAQHTPAQAEAIEVADANLNNADLPLYSQVVEINAELLESLERIANGREMSGQFTHAETVMRYQEMARAAIAKAEGRS